MYVMMQNKAFDYLCIRRLIGLYVSTQVGRYKNSQGKLIYCEEDDAYGCVSRTFAAVHNIVITKEELKQRFSLVSV